MQDCAALQFSVHMPLMHIISLSVPSEVFQIIFKNT